MEASSSLRKTYWKYSLVFFTGLGIVLLTQQPLFILIPLILLFIPAVVRKPEVLFLALLISLPLSFEVNINSKLATDIPSEFIMIILSGMFLIMFANDTGIVDRSILKHPLIILLLVHLTWMLVTVIFSENIFLSLKYFLAKTWYVIPFVFATQLFITNKTTVILLALCLTVPLAFITLLSLIRQAADGFSFEGIKSTYSPFFRNHVVYAAMLACILPIVISLLYKFSGWKRKCLMLTLILILSGIIFSYSRAAWLAVIGSGITVWAVRNKLMQWLFVLIFSVVVVGFTWFLAGNRYLDYRPDYNRTIFHDDLNAHMAATYNFTDVSMAERFYRWIAAFRMTRDNPVSGIGPNNFYDTYKSYTVGAYKTWVSRNEDHSSTHNYFLMILSEQGIPGLLFFVVLLICMFRYAERIYHKARHSFYGAAALVISAVLSVISVENFLSDLIETDKIGSIFFLCLGLLVVFENLQKKELADMQQG